MLLIRVLTTSYLQLSIIIINYNVKFFLEQCLCSIEKAIDKISAEVWVVDNASKDGSIEYLQSKFPSVKFIANGDNVGFAKANNAALQQCNGEYVLFLNPDTIVPEDCFIKCIDFLNTHSDAGALGIRMVDGSGQFLPESKRSFPTPLRSLFKLTGLTSLFPASKTFARYTLGYLDQHKNHEVDVLSGAFLMSKRTLLNEVNGFDETFFMYGEDVDLSYRLQETGYKNYYFSGSTIIHFKGESTKKGSLNYVRMFYQAMSIFVNKHSASGKAKIFSFFIQTAIFFRGMMAAFFDFILKIGLPLLDILIILGSFELINTIWIRYLREGHGFIAELVNIALPGFTVVFLLAATLAGIYDNKYKPWKAFYAALIAIVVMLAVYSLLPEKYRFSRGVILFGGVTASLFIAIFRWFLLKLNIVEDETSLDNKTLVAATPGEYQNVLRLLSEAGYHERVIGRVAVDENKEEAIGRINQLNTLIETLNAAEVIFCEGHLTFSNIISTIQQLPKGVSARFHSKKSNSIVGSDSKDESGESLSAEANFNLAHPYHRRMKKLLDVSLSLFIILTFPVFLLLKPVLVKYAFKILSGRNTWVGYASVNNKLPLIPTGILCTAGDSLATRNEMNLDSLGKIDYWYARDYNWRQDAKIIVKHFRKL